VVCIEIWNTQQHRNLPKSKKLSQHERGLIDMPMISKEKLSCNKYPVQNRMKVEAGGKEGETHSLGCHPRMMVQHKPLVVCSTWEHLPCAHRHVNLLQMTSQVLGSPHT